MKILKKKVGQPWEVVDVKNELEVLQKEVGGYIETVTLPESHAVVICDEEGMLKGKPYNTSVMGVDFVGDILMVGIKEDDFGDLPEAETMAKLLSSMYKI